MKKRILLIIILILTFLVLMMMYLFNYQNRYHKYIIDNSKWNTITKNKSINQELKLKSIKFNNYPLIIDDKNNIIYYSMMDVINKDNPKVKYTTNTENIKVAINTTLLNNNIKVMLYSDLEYKIYSLVVTELPIMNVEYDTSITNKVRIPMNTLIIDNNKEAIQRIVKSTGTIKLLNDSNEYIVSLNKESLGHNERKNHISILGMPKEDEYLLKKIDEGSNLKKHIMLLINNEYKGIYSINILKERSIDRNERRKEIK